MTWEWREHDRAKVLDCLRRGEYEAIVTSRQSALDALAHLAAELGVLEAASQMRVEREREGIPDALLLRTLAVLPFVEAVGLSAAADTVFEDAAILLQLGYTALQIQDGFNAESTFSERRGRGHDQKSERARPCHPEVLRAELARLTPESVAAFRERCVRQLFERDLVRGRTYALDGSGLGNRYRVVGLLNVTADRVLWVNWRVLSGLASEKGKEACVVRAMVDEVRAWGGPDVIEWLRLLMDALYADGPLLAWLKYARQIDAQVRLPEDRELYAELLKALSVWSLVRENPRLQQTHLDTRYVAGRKQLRAVTVGTMGDLDAWDTRSVRAAAQALEAPDAKLWGCTVQAVDQADPTQVETWALVSTRAFSTGWQAYTQWRQRWRIENSGFREVKEGWHAESTFSVEDAPWSYTDDIVVQARVAFTCVDFNIAQLAKTAEGRRLTQRGIRRLRRDLTREYGPAPVIVFAGGAYGIFHIEEIVAELGRPPQVSFRRSPHAAQMVGADAGPPLS